MEGTFCDGNLKMEEGDVMGCLYKETHDFMGFKQGTCDSVGFQQAP